MTKLIVFSYNRPMQLHALLDSVEIHTKGFFNKIEVIYKADKEFEAGYAILKAQKPYVKFTLEGIFKENLWNALELDYTCFAADDGIFYKDLNKSLYGAFTDATACFSLRLGLNIDYNYPNDKQQTIKNYKEEGDFIRWNWSGQDFDFGYPLSVVSHIFRTEDIKNLTDRIEFHDPNEYEGRLQIYLNEVKPEMVSYKHSVVFGVPANRVNKTTNNRNGIEHSFTTEYLNEKYLAGARVDVAHLGYTINAPQQEINYGIK